jgi:hypothetical protein
MRKYAFLLLILSAFFIVLHSGYAASTKALSPATDGHRMPVLIELFTSEGCSSCPPADRLLQKLMASQPVEGAEIIALEEHVDYWNRLGWADPFSSAEWTERQTAYAARFGNDAYTPELVIDGQTNFVGSDAQRAESAIRKAASGAKLQVAIRPETAESKGVQSFSISVSRSAQDIPRGDLAEVWLAVTEDGLHSSVSQGENSGRELNHVATLRSLEKIGVAGQSGFFAGTSGVRIDPHWDVAKLRVIVFVQERNSRQIRGAASLPVKG